MEEKVLVNQAIETFSKIQTKNVKYDPLEDSLEVETLHNEIDEVLESKNIENEIELLDNKIEAILEENTSLIAENEQAELINSDSEKENNILMFDEMSDEAKEIYFSYITTQDEELLNYYKTYINPDSALEYTPYRAVTRSGYLDPLSVLKAELTLLGLSTSVKNAFIGAGSSMLAMLSDGPLVVGDIVGIIIGAECVGIILANWSTVVEKWQGITDAFTKVFSGKITYDTLSSGLSQSETKYSAIYSEAQALPQMIRRAKCDKSAAKHIEMDAVKNIIRDDKPLFIYNGTLNRIVLYVYKIKNGTKASVNRDYKHRGSEVTGRYQKTKLDLSGTKVYII